MKNKTSAYDALSGIEMIAAERQRQIDEEVYDDDVQYNPHEELAKAAACYALPEDYRLYQGQYNKHDIPVHWHWKSEYWKPTPYNRIRE